MKNCGAILWFLISYVCYLTGTESKENYIQSVVLVVDGAYVTLSDGSMYIERFEKHSNLQVGDHVTRQSGNTVYGGMTYHLVTDYGSKMWSFLNVTVSEPYLYQIRELIPVENQFQIMLDDGSKWVASAPEATDPIGDLWYNPSWQVGDRVLISRANSWLYKMDNITKYNVAFVEWVMNN